jgi:hypothetical protein
MPCKKYRINSKGLCGCGQTNSPCTTQPDQCDGLQTTQPDQCVGLQTTQPDQCVGCQIDVPLDCPDCENVRELLSCLDEKDKCKNRIQLCILNMTFKSNEKLKVIFMNEIVEALSLMNLSYDERQSDGKIFRDVINQYVIDQYIAEAQIIISNLEAQKDALTTDLPNHVGTDLYDQMLIQIDMLTSEIERYQLFINLLSPNGYFYNFLINTPTKRRPSIRYNDCPSYCELVTINKNLDLVREIIEELDGLITTEPPTTKPPTTEPPTTEPPTTEPPTTEPPTTEPPTTEPPTTEPPTTEPPTTEPPTTEPPTTEPPTTEPPTTEPPTTEPPTTEPPTTEPPTTEPPTTEPPTTEPPTTEPPTTEPQFCGYAYAGQNETDVYDPEFDWWKPLDGTFSYIIHKFNNANIFGPSSSTWGWQINIRNNIDLNFPLYYNAGTSYDMTMIAGSIDVKFTPVVASDGKYGDQTQLRLTVNIDPTFIVNVPNDLRIFITRSITISSPINLDNFICETNPAYYTLNPPFSGTTSYTFTANVDLLYTDCNSVGHPENLLNTTTYWPRILIVVYVGGLCSLLSVPTTTEPPTTEPPSTEPPTTIAPIYGYAYAGQNETDIRTVFNGNYVYVPADSVGTAYNYIIKKFDSLSVFGPSTTLWGWQIEMISNTQFSFPLYFNAGTSYDMSMVAGSIDVKFMATGNGVDNNYGDDTTLFLTINMNPNYVITTPEELHIFIGHTLYSPNICVASPSGYTIVPPFNPIGGTQSYTFIARTNLKYTDCEDGQRKLLNTVLRFERILIVVHVGGICRIA